MSLALVAVIVAPRSWRPWVAVLAAGYAACVGVGLVLIAAHYPSDVAAGYLVATAWAAAMAALALGLRERNAPDPTPLRLPSAAAVLAVALLVLGGTALLLEPAAHLRHGIFAVSAVVIAALALLLPLGLTLVLARERRPRSARR
jgi:membrane-associated phospholipid phosphatase